MLEPKATQEIAADMGAVIEVIGIEGKSQLA